MHNTMTAIKQTMKGIITSKPSNTTAVVECTRFIQHPKYLKFFKRSKKFHAHDAVGAYHAGEQVVIEAMRPMSRTKRWRIVSKV